MIRQLQEAQVGDMKTYLAGALASGLILVLVAWTGLEPTGEESGRWEYGIYTENVEALLFTWSTAEAYYFGISARDAWTQMGMTDVENARKPHMLNFLGDQGWQLVDVNYNPAKEETSYFFRRPIVESAGAE